MLVANYTKYVMCQVISYSKYNFSLSLSLSLYLYLLENDRRKEKNKKKYIARKTLKESRNRTNQDKMVTDSAADYRAI